MLISVNNLSTSSCTIHELTLNSIDYANSMMLESLLCVRFLQSNCFLLTKDVVEVLETGDSSHFCISPFYLLFFVAAF